MKIKDLFEEWKLTGLRINAPFMEMEWKPSDPDKAAAWDLYVELLTRITTQPLPDEDGVEQTALDSIHALFDLTRQTLKDHGRSCIQFTRIAVSGTEPDRAPLYRQMAPQKPARRFRLARRVQAISFGIASAANTIAQLHRSAGQAG